MEIPFYQITLPMPVSVNASHTVGRNRRGGHIVRSSEYKTWLEYAAISWRAQFPHKVAELFTGRIRVDYIFCFIDGARGANASDISNREKVLSDFLQAKFFENDKQIDEQRHYRRLVKDGEPRVMVRIYETPDRRYDDPDLIFNPAKKDCE